jgi:maleate cis-trans isomerase
VLEDATRLGFLYPDHAAEDDLPWLVEALHPDGTVVADVVHTTISRDVHTVAALTETGSRARLSQGGAALVARGADVALWACTSGSFVFGLDGARRQADALSDDFRGPASSTSLGFVSALRARGVRRVALAATYPETLARHFVTYLEDAGAEVITALSHGISTAAAVGTLGREEVVRLVADSDHPDAEAVLVPDTALHTVRWLEELESTVGKPVLTANQVSVWEALRLAGHLTTEHHELGGALFKCDRIPTLETRRSHGHDPA